jgi:EAL domain-containing protein (putative c-di-GMP-specific phosphodiesterase class I)
VLDTALAQLRRWRDAGHAELTLAVNLSLMQFRQPDLLAVVQQSLARAGVPAQALELELTESIAMQEPE